MRVVHKFELAIGTTTLHLPPGSKCLYVGNQNETICAWIELDPNDQAIEQCDFRVFGTGHPIDDIVGMDITHVGSVLLYGGTGVFHVYRSSAKESK